MGARRSAAAPHAAKDRGAGAGGEGGELARLLPQLAALRAQASLLRRVGTRAQHAWRATGVGSGTRWLVAPLCWDTSCVLCLCVRAADLHGLGARVLLRQVSGGTVTSLKARDDLRAEPLPAGLCSSMGAAHRMLL